MKPDTGSWVWSWPFFQPSLPALNLPATCLLPTSNESADKCLPGHQRGGLFSQTCLPAHCSWLCTYNTQSHTYTPHRVTHTCSLSPHELSYTQLYPHTYTHNCLAVPCLCTHGLTQSHAHSHSVPGMSSYTHIASLSYTPLSSTPGVSYSNIHIPIQKAP